MERSCINKVIVSYRISGSKYMSPDFKIIISQKLNTFESNHSDESDIGEI